MNALARRTFEDAEQSVPVLVPKGQEVLWRAIYSTKGKPFVARDIARQADCTEAHAENYLLRLIKAGIAIRAGSDPSGRAVFQAAGLPHAPAMLDSRGQADSTFQIADEVWRAVKMMKVFTLNMLLAQMDKATPRDAVRSYLQALEQAQYLIDLQSTEDCGQKEWKVRPAMVTGPLPPRLMRATFLFDRNRQTISNVALLAQEVRL